MQTPGNPHRRSRPAVLISVIAHGALFASLLILNTRFGSHIITSADRKVFPGIQVAGGSHATRLFLPPALSTVEARKPAKEAPAVRKPAAPIHHTPPVKSAGGTAAAAHQTSNGSGDTTQGDGSDAQNADPAFPVFAPKPPVTDRKLLPDSQREIVVDVNVNAAGEVTAASLVKSMGNVLDQIVLDTVKTWRFHPATVNGSPVASQAELIFPFNPNYPVTPS